MDRSDKAFAVHKAVHVAEAMAANLRRLTPDKNMRARIITAGRVSVCGGGHTLPGDIPATSGPIVAGNSAVRALLHRDVVPDFIVCRESIDMSAAAFDPLTAFPQAKRRTVAVLDVGVNPKTWEAAERVCADVWWFVPANTQTFGLAARLGVEPCYWGQTNVTGSVGLAEAMGAREINLYGASRAYSLDGRAYASGNPGWDTVRLGEVETRGDVHVGTILGTEAKAELHEASSQRPPLKRERVVKLTGVDGQPRWALESTVGSGEWLANFAARRPHITCTQHFPDVAIPGWGHAPALPVVYRVADPVADAMAQVDHVRDVAARILAGDAVHGARYLDGSDLVDFHHVGSRVRILDAMKGRAPQEVIPMVVKAWLESAERLSVLVGK